MKRPKVLAEFLLFLAGLLGAMTVVLAFCAVRSAPGLVYLPEEAVELPWMLMKEAQQGNFRAVSLLLQGSPELGLDREPETPAGKLLWQAFTDSFSYKIPGECYPEEAGIGAEVEVTYLDLDSILPSLRERTCGLLEEKMKNAESSAELYDRDNQFKRELVEEILDSAVKQGIAEDGKMIQKTLTLHMVYDGKHWRVVPKRELLHVLSGGTAE